MKIKFDIDCTPQEARAFLGLPDVGPMQEAMLTQVQEQLMANLSAMEPEALLRTWLPGGLQGLDQMQKAFWTQFGESGRPDSPKGDKTGDETKDKE